MRLHHMVALARRWPLTLVSIVAVVAVLFSVGSRAPSHECQHAPSPPQPNGFWIVSYDEGDMCEGCGLVHVVLEAQISEGSDSESVHKGSRFLIGTKIIIIDEVHQVSPDGCLRIRGRILERKPPRDLSVA